MNVPGRAWWVPRTEDELKDAITRGLLEESHYLELKRQVDEGPKANRELARDMCGFSVDGGLLLIGVAEGPDHQRSLSPITFGRLAERVEQVARSLIRPRLPISITAIPSSDDPTRGYLAIEIPASPVAPHMVDHKYFGRGDKTKYAMDDAEVDRLHRLRDQAGEDSRRVLDWLVSRDPVPMGEQKHAHFFFIARPTRPLTQLTVDLVRRHDFWDEFRNILGAAAKSVPSTPDGYGASLLSLTSSPARRLDGIALSERLTYDRRPDGDARDPESIYEVELAESGEVRIFIGRLSDTGKTAFSDELEELLFDGWVPELVREGISVAAQVAQRFDYRGPWSLGVAMTRIGGLTVYSNARELTRSPRKIESTADHYRAWTQATGDELSTTPGALTEALVGRFLRAAGSERQHLKGLLADDQVPTSG